MNFNQLSYLPGLVILFIVLSAIVLLMEKRFFTFIKTYWFFNRSLFSYISTILFLVGMGGLLLSLLDLRGREEKIKMPAPTERTVILIDTSASMLAEDVKPSRLQKATLMAKHFARKAAGHQISIVAFAEIQKKIVPFTNDLDLIDARLDSIENLRNHYGSSALTNAIQESIQYFRETGEPQGNILVYTDGEETAEGINLRIPENIRLALVGIGTEEGGKIPLDDGRGFRFGYKKERGRDIVTKLNESFFREVAADVSTAKYWVANSYSLPSEEIVGFFRNEKLKDENKQDMVIKPVLVEWIVVPSLLLMILSYLLKSVRIFTLSLMIFLSPAHAQEQELELSPDVMARIEDLQKGDLSRLEKLKLADDLHKAGAKDEAISLYQENLPKGISKELPPEAYLNYGTALLEKGEAARGLSVYQNLSRLLDDSERSRELQKMMDKNVVSFFRKQEEKKKQQEKQNKENKKNKEQKDQQSGSGQQNDQKNQSGQQQDQNKSQGNQNEKKEEKDQKGEEKDKKKNDENQDGEDEQKKNDGNEGDQENKPMPKRKMPAKLKQLMSDDRQLQMKMIENGTRDLNRRKSRKSKDW